MVNSVFLEEANEQDVIDIYQGLSNVKRPSNIKHCLVTKHADVEVSGQRVETCLI